MEPNPLFQPYFLQSLQQVPLQSVQLPPQPIQQQPVRIRQFNVARPQIPVTTQAPYRQQPTAKSKAEERTMERVQHILNTLPPNAKINTLVDIGAGNAEITDKIARTLGASEAYALDVYPTAEFVKPFPNSFPSSIVQYIQVVDENLPFQSAEIDLVTAFVSIHHIEDTISLFSEICRILKPGGFFFFREHDVTNEILRIYLDQIHEKYEKDPHEHSIKPTYYWSRQSLSNYLVRHGFQKVADSDYDPQHNPQASYHSLYMKVKCPLTVYISDKSEDWRYVEDSFSLISPSVIFVKTWEEAIVIWKPTPARIDPVSLPKLKYLNNLLTSAATLTEKSSLLKIGMGVLGPDPTGFFSIVPYSLEYNKDIQFDIYLPESFQNGLSGYALSGLGDSMWITKPAAGFSGKGVRVFNNRNLLLNSFRSLPSNKRIIIQKYIENPFLINGYKFDIRMYVLITGDRILMYPEGFVRVAPLPYSKNDTNLARHLTNISIHETGNKTVTILTLDQLESAGIKRESIYLFIGKLRPLFEYALRVEQEYKLANDVRFETFELFGLDIMFDDTGKAWLLEINKNPGALSNTPSLIPDVLKETVFSDSRQATKFVDIVQESFPY